MLILIRSKPASAQKRSLRLLELSSAGSLESSKHPRPAADVGRFILPPHRSRTNA
jgi:hypothetical protein